MLGVLSAMLCCGAVSAQQHEVEMIPFGNMDQWIDRQIKESGIIGGATKNVYAIGPTATVTETIQEYGRFAVGDIQCDGPGSRYHEN